MSQSSGLRNWRRPTDTEFPLSFDPGAQYQYSGEGFVWLARVLEGVSDRYDWCLVDCPPRADGVLCANAVRASDTALLVVETGAFALQGALNARTIFADIAEGLGRPLAMRLIATLYQPRSPFAREVLVAMQARFGADMLDSVIRESVRLRESAGFGVPVRLLDRESPAVRDFEALAREVMEIARRSPSVSVRTVKPF